MNIRRLCALLLSLALPAVGLLSLAQAAWPSSPQKLAAWADHAVKQRLGGVEWLGQLAPDLLLRGGAREQDGIFITADYLIENIAPGDPDILEANLSGIEDFLDRTGIPATVLLIPTACAIKQKEIPARAEIYNQKALIASAYQRLSGRAGTVDAYTELFSAAGQYTYYRTESNLTGLGGYYVYRALAARLGLTVRALDQFEVEHLAQDYYGDLYERSSYKGIAPDIVTLYRFSRYDRQYRLAHTAPGGESKSYYTLFPRHLAHLGHPEQVLLGGMGQRLDISVASPYEDSLLLLADKTALAYLPFLVVHYGNVTVLSLENSTLEQIASVRAEDYDQVVLAYSVDSFLTRPVAAGARLLS